MKKLQLETDAHLEIIMVMMINIREDPLHHSPKEGLTAWHTFRHYTKCSSFKEFVKMKQMTDGDSGALGDGEKKINICKHSGRMTAHGVDMQAVDVMISEGLVKIWDAIIHFSKQLDPNADTDSLEATNVPWDFDWQQCQISITNATECTAHEWLQTWEHFQDVGELIDIDNHSDVSEEELELGMADQFGHRPAAIVPANRSTLDHTSESVSDPLVNKSMSNPTVTDPLTTNTSSTSHKALDVEFFF
ncbi:hypothetical protein BS17DRAFT_821237 [Gyrodon lividus]|nr:hypothetical protein BS17DRAFT_821237 [Gyrodon lividus]